MDAAHQVVAKRLTKVAFVTSDRLTDKGDLAHFDAASARELGKRFAVAMIDLQEAQ